MPAKPLPSDLPIYTFASPSALEAFLSDQHQTLPGFYIKLAKKTSGIPSVTAPQAVEVMLMFGWIDGRGGAVDETYWLVRYTPRRAKSMWSAKNVATVGRLEEAGKMREAGTEAVEAAKRDGRWERAYAGPKDITIPEDFKEALEKEPQAKAHFETLKSIDRYMVLFQVHTASSDKVRANRIKKMVTSLKEGNYPAQPGAKRKTKDVTLPEAKQPATKKIKKHASSDESGIIPTQDATRGSSDSRRAGLRPRYKT